MKFARRPVAPMPHNEFVRAFEIGDVRVHIEAEDLKFLIFEAMPKRYRRALEFWFIVSILLYLSSPILWYFWGWPWAMAAIILGWITRSANSKSAPEHVIMHAVEDAEFYENAMRTGRITLHQLVMVPGVG